MVYIGNSKCLWMVRYTSKYAWSYTLNHDKPMSSDTWRETYVGPKHFKFITHFPKYADSAPKKGKNVHFFTF